MATPARAPEAVADPAAPVAVRYTGPLVEVYAFPTTRRRNFTVGVPVELSPEEIASMLTHPEFEPVTAQELAHPKTVAGAQED